MNSYWLYFKDKWKLLLSFGLICIIRSIFFNGLLEQLVLFSKNGILLSVPYIVINLLMIIITTIILFLFFKQWAIRRGYSVKKLTIKAILYYWLMNIVLSITAGLLAALISLILPYMTAKYVIFIMSVVLHYISQFIWVFAAYYAFNWQVIKKEIKQAINLNWWLWFVGCIIVTIISSSILPVFSIIIDAIYLLIVIVYVHCTVIDREVKNEEGND